MYYDLEAIRRFVDTVGKNDNDALRLIAMKRAARHPIEPGERDKSTLDGVDMADLRAAVRALAALLYAGVDLKKELGLKFKTGPKEPRTFDMTIHSAEFMVLCSLAGGAITKTEARNMLFRIGDADDLKTVNKFIRARSGAAERFITSFPELPDEFKPFLTKQELEKIIQNR